MGQLLQNNKRLVSPTVFFLTKSLVPPVGPLVFRNAPEVWETWFGMQWQAKRSWFAACSFLSSWISLRTGSSFCLSTFIYAQRWCKNLAMVGKWRICLRPSHMSCTLAIKFRVFVCLPRLSLIDVAVEVRSQLRKDKSVGKILDGKTKQTHACSPFAFSCRCGYSCSPHSKSCQTWG